MWKGLDVKEDKEEQEVGAERDGDEDDGVEELKEGLDVKEDEEKEGLANGRDVGEDDGVGEPCHDDAYEGTWA